MGGCHSHSCSNNASSAKALKCVRVVHLNGYVEDFVHPVTVGRVTGKPPKHFVCTQTQLVSLGSKALKPDVLLELGHVYFLLPFTMLQGNVSPVDLAFLAKRLTRVAKITPSLERSCRARLWRPNLETIREG